MSRLFIRSDRLCQNYTIQSLSKFFIVLNHPVRQISLSFLD
jgi:hypothetical protein